MISDKKLQRLYDQYLEFTVHMCVEHSPMEVAAIMMTQALSLYRTSMNEDEYNQMVDVISGSRTQIKTFDKPVIQ
jgi:hypothetical protein